MPLYGQRKGGGCTRSTEAATGRAFRLYEWLFALEWLVSPPFRSTSHTEPRLSEFSSREAPHHLTPGQSQPGSPRQELELPAAPDQRITTTGVKQSEGARRPDTSAEGSSNRPTGR